MTRRRIGRPALTAIASVCLSTVLSCTLIAPAAADVDTATPPSNAATPADDSSGSDASTAADSHESTKASPTVTSAATAKPAKASRIESVVATTKQQVTALVYSASMNKVIPVSILRPRDTGKPAPTLYLLNGAGGGEDTATWAAKTDYVKFFADKHVNVVTPIGGAFSYYTDWQRTDPVLGVNKWQTFLTKELPPLIDKKFGTTGANAIAGISMAGTSVMNLAIATPKLYRAVAAFSGCARTSDPLGQAYIRAVVGDRGRGNVDNMWGPPGSLGWVANDPYLNAIRLRGMKVYMTAGSGLPGPDDTMTSPLIDGDALKLANQVLLGGGIELAVNLCTREMATRLQQLRVPADVTFRPSGTHSWSYWETDLHNTWPKLEKDLA